MRHPPSASTVRWAVIATIAVSLFHFTDNAINVDTYPKAGWQPGWFDIVVVVAWFAYTAIGVVGLRAYGQGRFRMAHICLLLYGYAIFSSLGHFLYGSPGDLTTRGLISVFVDVTAGTIVMALAIWSILARRTRAPDAAASRP
jgi:hypothetical protein